MKKTKKIVALVLAAVMLVCTTVAATVAYLTSTTEIATNTFTVGNVKIILNEADEDEDKLNDVNYVHGTEARDTKNAYHVFPNGTYAKDPMVSVRKDSEDSYIRMIVTVSDIQALKDAMPDNVADDGTFLLQNLVDWNNADWLFNNYKEVDGKGVYEFWYKEMYSVPEDATVVAVTGGKDGEAGEYVELSPLFTTITLPADLDNDHLAYLNEVSIDVVAHAMQADGFANAADAWDKW